MSSLPYWQYLFIAGGFLIICELVITEFFLLWLGIACLLTSFVTYVFSFDLLGITLSFVGFSIVCLYAGYTVYDRRSVKIITSGLNNRMDALIGETAILRQDDTQGATVTIAGHATGHYIVINDTRWPAASADDQLKNGVSVRVIAIRGNTLWVVAHN